LTLLPQLRYDGREGNWRAEVMKFAGRLRQLRREQGLTRKELAGRSGLGVNTVRDYEQGLREPSLRSAFALADALSVLVDDFRDGKRKARGKK
jgi:transcriptional regulator with XRE-family HTH domain